MPSYDTNFRTLAVGALTNLYNGATVTIHAGTAGTGDTLATLTLPGSPWGTASSGNRGLASSIQVTISATGTAQSYRCVLTGGQVETGTIGTSGTDMITSTTSLVSGGTFTITAWDNSFPASS